MYIYIYDLLLGISSQNYGDPEVQDLHWQTGDPEEYSSCLRPREVSVSSSAGLSSKAGEGQCPSLKTLRH